MSTCMTSLDGEVSFGPSGKIEEPVNFLSPWKGSGTEAIAAGGPFGGAKAFSLAATSGVLTRLFWSLPTVTSLIGRSDGILILTVLSL